MSVIVLLIAAGGTVAAGFLVAFVWAVSSGQFDDTTSPPLRVLFDDAAGPGPGQSPRTTTDLNPKDRTHAHDAR